MDTTDVSLLHQESHNEQNATWQKGKIIYYIRVSFHLEMFLFVFYFANHDTVFAEEISVVKKCFPVLS